MKYIIIIIIGLLSPVFVINYWHGDSENLPAALIFAFILLCAFIACFIVGIIRKRRVQILALPAFVISIIGMFAILNCQSVRNKKNADRIIGRLEKFKGSKGYYPNTLNELIPIYLEKVPKAWFGIYYTDFTYINRKHEFSLRNQVQSDSYSVYESALGEWQFSD
ncbi:hypothetical protein WG904_04765 [Pedobacter sp. Du54]|uniref:hypothetical protein n=1 Tax=Pedobacter anseongensis TaxID=3133439 RepID=UPI0030AB5FA2